MTDTIIKLDNRGRAAIATHVRKNGVEPSEWWSMSFGEFGAVILTPVVMQPRRAA